MVRVPSWLDRLKRFAQSQEVVGRIGEPHEASGDLGNASAELDGVLAALPDLQRQVDGMVVVIRLHIDGGVFLQRLEISQLVQAQDAQPPQVRVKRVAFVNQQFAADHLVAGGGVARRNRSGARRTGCLRRTAASG